MKTTHLTALALTAALLIGQPAFAYEQKDSSGGGGGHATAAASHAAPAHVAAAGGAGVARGGPGSFAGTRGAGNSVNTFHGNNFSARGNSVGRTFSNPSSSYAATRAYSAPPRAYASSVTARSGSINSRIGARTPTVAFSGNNNNGNRNFSGNNRGGGRNSATFAFRSHDGWSTGRQYDWRGHHYRYYNNAWFIIDPYPYYAGSYYGGDYYDQPYTTYYNTPDDGNNGGTGNVSADVQQALAQAGYYHGPIDGIVGPGTSGAIAAFQRDNDLRVSGTINRSTLAALGIGQ